MPAVSHSFRFVLTSSFDQADVHQTWKHGWWPSYLAKCNSKPKRHLFNEYLYDLSVCVFQICGMVFTCCLHRRIKLDPYWIAWKRFLILQYSHTHGLTTVPVLNCMTKYIYINSRALLYFICHYFRQMLLLILTVLTDVVCCPVVISMLRRRSKEFKDLYFCLSKLYYHISKYFFINHIFAYDKCMQCAARSQTGVGACFWAHKYTGPTSECFVRPFIIVFS